MRGDESAFPVTATEDTPPAYGLTIREHFAAMTITSVTDEVNRRSCTVEDIAKHLGISTREYDHDIHWDRWVAFCIRKRADAIIAELSKESP